VLGTISQRTYDTIRYRLHDAPATATDFNLPHGIRQKIGEENLARKRLNYCSQTTSCITEQFDEADESLSQTVISDNHHVMHHLLPGPIIMYIVGR